LKKLIALIALINILLLPQTDRKELLEELKSRGDIIVTEEGNDIYRIEFPEGRVEYYNLGKQETTQADTIPTTVIETWNVDTMLYRDMYYFSQEVIVATSKGYELIIGDVNKNKFPEIYGYKKDFDGPPIYAPTHIYEIDSTGIFSDRFTYPDSVVAATGLYDILGDEKPKLLTRSYITGYSLFFGPDSINSLPIAFIFIFSLYPGQIDHPKFDDFDKNGITDMLFYYDDERGTHICEYNYVINNFEIVRKFLQPNGFYVGYAIGDFDLDNKTDIVYGGIDGEAFVIEADSEHNYSLVWEKVIGGHSSYMQMATNDIDKNGKPEFWVSSITNNGVMDVTSVTSFEYIGDNEYKETYRIDFVGVYPLYAGNIFPCDVDKDGTEELVFCIGDYVFIMQFRGNYLNPSYEIFYMTRDNLPGGFRGITMYDLDKDDYEEILIHRTFVRNDGKAKHCTHIFKPDFIVTNTDEMYNVVSEYSLEQNYPNPFNPATSIRYSLAEDGFVTLNVYDMLGSEVAELVNSNQSAGNYELSFNASELSSGIYIYRLTAMEGDRIEFSDTKRMILLK
jgi:hypothetical protein